MPTSCRAGLTHLLWFTVSIAGVGLFLSAVARSWIELSWWTIFRRCASIAALASLAGFLWYVHGQTIRSLGLGSWKTGKPQLLQGIVLGCGTVLVVGSVYLALGACQVSVHPDRGRVVRTLLSFVPAAGLVAVLEELVFRGYVLQQLSACSRVLALGGSSLAYALVHLRPTVVWPQSGFELTGLFILGWVLALSVLRSQQLYFAIGLHAVLAYCARVNKLLVAFPESPLQWLVGTNRLVNGTLAWAALCGIGWIADRWLRRSEAARLR